MSFHIITSANCERTNTSKCLIIGVRTEVLNDDPILKDIETLWQTEGKGDGDAIVWMDHYDPSRFSERCPAIGAYLAEHPCDEVTIYNFWS